MTDADRLAPVHCTDTVLAAAQKGDALAAYIYGLETYHLRTFYAGSARWLSDELRACLAEAWKAWEGRKNRE